MPTEQGTETSEETVQTGEVCLVRPEGSYHKRLLTCFVMNLKIVSKELMSRVKQATKDVVKSEV